VTRQNGTCGDTAEAAVLLKLDGDAGVKAMKPDDLQRVEALFDQLSLADKLLLIERLVRRVRQGAVDEAARAREMEEMANDPDIQRVLRGEDLTSTANATPTEPAA
jgi:hypothetical protein